MKRLIISFALSMFFIRASAQTAVVRSVKLMGAKFDITIVASDSLSAARAIDDCIAEIRRIEYLISDWIDTTQVSRINQQAGLAPVKADKELIALTLRAINLSKITGGAFDITFAAMERIWKYDGSMTTMPSAKAVAHARRLINYRDIIVDTIASTIFLKKKGMKIGFGALGEGYAADRCKMLMLQAGFNAGIVNGSGDMNTWGRQPDGTPWKIGIRDPFKKSKIIAIVPLEKGAVVTSGNYEKYFEIGDKRYSHIINPVTGYPATGLTSVTVFGPSAELANGFSTSLMIMGKKAGLKFLAKFPDYICLMIGDNGEFTWSPNMDASGLSVD